MSPASPGECARCGGSLSEGYLLDRGSYDYPHAAEWVEGPPVKSFWSGLEPGKQQLSVRVFRCERCGVLEFRAPSA